MKKVKKLKGFTLVETILVVVLTFLILGCAFSILAPMRNIFDDAYRTKDSMDVNDFAGKAIERDLRYANRVYVLNGFHLNNTASETEFMNKCVTKFRQDFLFTNDPDMPEVKRRIFGDQSIDDVVYVMKLNNMDSNADGTSRGYISRYTYRMGSMVNSESKPFMVNPVIYDDRDHNMGYTINFELGFNADAEAGVNGSEAGAGHAISGGVNPESLCINLTTYKSRLISISNAGSVVAPNFQDSLARQTVSFPLVNCASAGAILFEKIPFIKTDDTRVTADGEVVKRQRFKYFDSTLLSTEAGINATAGKDIYFVYTEVTNVPVATS